MGGAARQEAGFSLLAVVVGLAISVATTLALVQLLAGHLRHVARQEALLEQQQTGRAAMALLARELSLAGLPVAPDPRCHSLADSVETGPSDITFLANLHGVRSVLSAPADAGATALAIPANDQIASGAFAVSRGAEFRRGDAVYVYDAGAALDPGAGGVECHRLDRDGRSGVIPLAAGESIGRSFARGAVVEVVNLVRYARNGATRQLIRAVDGGAQSVIEQVAGAGFQRSGGYLAARLVLDPRPSLAGPAAGPAVWQMLTAMRNGSRVAGGP